MNEQINNQIAQLSSRVSILERDKVSYSMPWEIRENICRAVIQQTNGDFLTFRFLGKQFNVQVTNVVNLVDAATVTLDSALGSEFVLNASGDRTIAVPLHAVDGQTMIIRHKAIGANRTLTLTTGSTGSFRFNATISTMSATSSGLTDYIGCIYNGTDAKWDLLFYVKGA